LECAVSILSVPIGIPDCPRFLLLCQYLKQEAHGGAMFILWRQPI
jgi:hypothetical protein